MLEEHPYGTGPGNDAYYQRLQGAGIAVSWSPATFQLSHDKYAVADDRVALLGTPNWTLSAFTSNREYLVEDSDATDVAQLATLFEADWKRQPAAIDDFRLVVSPVNSRADFLSMINAAQHDLDLEAEEMQDPQIEAALGQAARRGVAVRAIVAAPTDAHDANGPGRQLIAAQGVKVRLLRQPYVHAKDIVVDGHDAFVGSENISTSSLDENREVGLLISDSTAIGKLKDTFDRDWQAAR
jgi:phosphatidylserine/phosphatidylglycerophosphate/cardiolipin synthase-like enzyme